MKSPTVPVVLRSFAALVSVLVLARGSALCADDAPIATAPGSVVRWVAPDTESCRFGDRSWAPHDETCFFPIDLDASGQLRIGRVRAGAEEWADVIVGEYPYRVQHIKLKDSRRVDLSKQDAERSASERTRIEALWELETPRSFGLPLAPPLARMEPQGSFGSKRYFNGQPRSPHSGEDYRAGVGTEVFAVADGTVALAEEHFFGGKSVFIDHGDGLISMYLHLNLIEVAAGDRVDEGQRVGRAGSTGRATGPHLHFGFRWHGARVDPALLLR